MLVLSVAVILGLVSQIVGTEGRNSEFQAMVFLYRYGYISERNMSAISNMHDPIFEDIVTEAMSRYQEFYGLDVTGEMNDETQTLMNMPRCGLEDKTPFLEEDQAHSRKKRYVLQGNRWQTTSLKYRVNSYHSRSGWNLQRVQRQMERVFQMWGSVSDLVFLNATSTNDRDVQLEIGFQSGRHGDGDRNGFDGPSGTLAHAFYPNPGIGGDIHFDDEENWSDETTGSTRDRGIDLFSVALHEAGHALGLAHSPVREAVMYASYFGAKHQLHSDDVQGIQALYGGSRFSPNRSPVNPGPPDTSAPNLCNIGSVDAALTSPQGVYIFKDKFCYRLLPNLRGTAPGYPQLITKEFPKMENVKVDAALSWPNGEVFLFAGNRVWTFRQGVLARPVQNIGDRFPGIEGNIEAAVLWPVDKRTYFFKGDQYWRYDNTTRNPVKSMFPQVVSRWRGVKRQQVDAVLNINSNTYFFQEDSYSRYNNLQYRVNRNSPRNIRDLFGCTSFQAQEDERGLVDVKVKSDCPDEEDGRESSLSGRRKPSRTDQGNTAVSEASISVATAAVVLMVTFPHFVHFL